MHSQYLGVGGGGGGYSGILADGEVWGTLLRLEVFFNFRCSYHKKKTECTLISISTKYYFFPTDACCPFLYRHECFTGKYTSRKIHTKLHPGPEWRIFHILTSEDIEYVTCRSLTFVFANSR